MSGTFEAIIKHTGATSEKKSASATSQTMKAIRIHNYGGPEVLQYEDAPRPEPQAGGSFLPSPPGGGEPHPLENRGSHLKKLWPPKFPLLLRGGVLGQREENRKRSAAPGPVKRS